MASGCEKLDTARRNAVTDRLRANLISGAYCLHANPFKPQKGWETLVAEFSLGGRTDYRSLSAALILKHETHYYAAAYHSDDGQSVAIDEVYEIDADLDYNAFKAVAFDIGFGINGMEFYLFDDTYSWCLATVVDAQLLTGDADFMGAWYPDPVVKKAAVDGYLRWIEEVPVDEPYRQMRHYIVPSRA